MPLCAAVRDCVTVYAKQRYSHICMYVWYVYLYRCFSLCHISGVISYATFACYDHFAFAFAFFFCFDFFVLSLFFISKSKNLSKYMPNCIFSLYVIYILYRLHCIENENNNNDTYCINVVYHGRDAQNVCQHCALVDVDVVKTTMA